MTNTRQTKAAPTAPWRCAIYTRKSTEEGLEQDFNSLDAQREAAEAYIHARPMPVGLRFLHAMTTVAIAAAISTARHSNVSWPISKLGGSIVS